MHTTKGLELPAISELKFESMQLACRSLGWHDAQIAAISFEPDCGALPSPNDLDVVVEATGNPRACIIRAEAAIVASEHLIMGNVEAVSMIGPLLTKKAVAAGVCYSMANGDQPAH